MPAETPGITILRNMAHLGESEDAGTEALIQYRDVRVPSSAMLGDEGSAFGVAQVRLGADGAPRHADGWQCPAVPGHDGRAGTVEGHEG